MSQLAAVVADLIGVKLEDKGSALLQSSTPGPWKAVQRQLEPDTFYVVSLNRLHNLWGMAVQVSWQRRAPDNPQRRMELRTNAQMIAAAPEAIAACLELARGDGSPESLRRALELAEHAISKAEGKDHE